MYIEKATIKNIKSIKDLEITFPKPAGWHVIIGDNGSGKSSILKAIALALIGPYEVGALRLNLGEYVNYNAERGSIDLDMKFHEIDYLYSGFRAPENSIFSFNIELAREKNNIVRVKQGKNENGKKVTTEVWKNFLPHGFYSSSFGPFRRFSGGNNEWEKTFFSTPKTFYHQSIFSENIALTESLEWLVHLNYKKLEGEEIAKLKLDFLIKFINESNLLPAQVEISKITSEGVFFRDANSKTISVTEMSDGFRSVLSMTFEIIRQLIEAFEIVMFEKYIVKKSLILDIQGVILIDEIDAHLHPTWQTKIGNWFTKYFPNIQFIVTTHSPLICRAAENGSIWQLAEPGSDDRIKEITGLEKERLINGNILDAYGTELFGQSPIRSAQSDKKLTRLGELNMLYALGKIGEEEAKERLELQKILMTDDPTGF